MNRITQEAKTLNLALILIERRLPVLKKHMEQADIYFKHKGKKNFPKPTKSARAFTVF